VLFRSADYVIDAIDTVYHKLDLIETVCNAGVTLYSSMGMALKMDPSRIKTASIWKTSGCPLARVVRQGLRKRGFTGNFTVVYSTERLRNVREMHNVTEVTPQPETNRGKTINGSAVTVTAAAGFFLASLVLRDVTGL
jgi:tRNA A37 threonylcarbamoyladenosine dehydratase